MIPMEIVPDFEIEAIARALLPKIRDYYLSAEGQEELRKWKKRQAEADSKEHT